MEDSPSYPKCIVNPLTTKYYGLIVYSVFLIFFYFIYIEKNYVKNHQFLFYDYHND
jgi:hypothetical protein